MRFGRPILTAVVAALLAVGSLAKAPAATVPLASFAQRVSGATPFHYTDGLFFLSDATLSVDPTAEFKFVGLSAGLPSDDHATMVISATALGAPGGAPSTTQPFAISSIKFLGSGAHAGMTLLELQQPLGVGQYGGVLGGSSTGLSGSEPAPGLAIAYHSDFASDAALNFGLERDYSLSFTSLTVPLALEPILGLDFVTHSASASGVFGFTPFVPEPGTVAMLVGLGVSGSLFGLKLRRRA